MQDFCKMLLLRLPFLSETGQTLVSPQKKLAMFKMLIFSFFPTGNVRRPQSQKHKASSYKASSSKTLRKQALHNLFEKQE